MKKQITPQALQQEFAALKKELFGGAMFVALPNNNEDPEATEKWARYDQLLAFFYPCFRTRNWINPLTAKN